jgi:predicted nucleotidyltransferase
VDDPVLAHLVADAEADEDTLALVLAGSRAHGHEHADSDYDVYLVRTTPEKPAVPGRVEAAVTTLDELRALEPYWWTDGLVAGRVLVDKSDGALARELERLSIVPDGAAHAAYDGYLNAFVRGLGAARRGDELGQRLHAADSVRFLVRALHALEGRRAPFHDRLDTLPDEWRYPLLEVLRTADPAAQRALQQKVEALMADRGELAHEEWGENLTRAKRG